MSNQPKPSSGRRFTMSNPTKQGPRLTDQIAKIRRELSMCQDAIADLDGQIEDLLKTSLTGIDVNTVEGRARLDETEAQIRKLRTEVAELKQHERSQLVELNRLETIWAGIRLRNLQRDAGA